MLESEIIISALTFVAYQFARGATDEAIEDAYKRVKKTVWKKIGHKENIDKEFDRKGIEKDDWKELKNELTNVVSGDLSDIKKAVQDLVMLVHEQSAAPFLVPSAPSYHLTGRDDLLCELKQTLFAGKDVTLHGLPGVGKTAVALELVHDPDVIAYFKDGILWAGLGCGADPFPHLGRWAVALGIPQDEINNFVTIEERILAINDAIGSNQMLFVIDDVWEINASFALSVGGRNCSHLISTRVLDVALGSTAKKVCELSEKDGMELLKKFVPEIVENYPEKVKELVEAAGMLPLALVVIGRHLQREAIQRMDPLEVVCERLQESKGWLWLEQRMHHPSLQDVPQSLVTIIGISDKAMDEDSRSALRVLSIFPPKPSNFSREAALAVTSASTDTLKPLTEYGLLEINGMSSYALKEERKNQGETRYRLEELPKGREQPCYTLHQTIADYARIDYTDEIPYKRMVEYFLNYIEASGKNYTALDLEFENILATLQAAYDRNMRKELIRGANTIFYFLRSKGLYETAKVHLDRAKEAAEFLSDTRGLMTTLYNLAQIADAVENFKQAEEYFKDGLKLAIEINNIYKIIDFYRNLGIVASKRGKYAQAEEYLEEGLNRANQINNMWRTCGLLQSLGILASQCGYYTQAEKYFHKGLDLMSKTNNKGRISSFYVSLGILAGQCGDFKQAEENLEKGLDLAHETEDPMRITSALVAKGILGNQCGEFAQAEACFSKGLSLARETKYRGKISAFLVSWGFLEVIRGNYRKAEEYLREGLEIAESMGYKDRVSTLLAYLGALETKRGNYTKAEDYLQKGLDVVRKIDNPEKKSIVLENLGVFACDYGTSRQARKYLLKGLRLARTIKNPERISSLYKSLGALETKYEKFGKAEKHLQKGLDIACKIQHQWRICEICNEWGEYYLKLKEFDLAYENFSESLGKSQKMGAQELTASALFGLARVAAGHGRIDEARCRSQESRRIFESIGHKRAADVDQFLTGLS